MSSIPARPPSSASQASPRPAWEIAYLFPPQGLWSEEEYLALSGNRLVEFTDGFVEVLPMPTMIHQLIVAYFYNALSAFVRSNSLGTVLFAPFRIRIHTGRFREPDVMFMMAAHASRMGNEFWEGADLVVEVVSDDDRRRDLETKRFEYGQTGIPEYWIIDPKLNEVTVLKLSGDHYEVHGVFGPGQKASSVLIGGFEVDVADTLAGS